VDEEQTSPPGQAAWRLTGGGSFRLVQRDGVVVARLSLLDRTVLPEDWYAVPIAPFEILLDVQTVDVD
jgi:hypothetical protein